jgi:hypothetical protein
LIPLFSSGNLRALHPKAPLLSHPQLKGVKMCKKRGKAAAATATPASPISSSSNVKLVHQAALFHVPIRYIPSGKSPSLSRQHRQFVSETIDSYLQNSELEPKLN